jgi:hypothetical protein
MRSNQRPKRSSSCRREVFPNCPRYIHKDRLVERSRFVPKANCPTPVPNWKRSEWARGVLPANDPARADVREKQGMEA